MQQMGFMGNKKTNANSVLLYAPCQGKILVSLRIQWINRLCEGKMVLHAKETCFVSQEVNKAHLEGAGAYVACVRTCNHLWSSLVS